MEVHKHPHHVMHSKKISEYLLEFFMLFLAVFLGFIAENVRENLVEHHREKEYIESMINDLKNDTTKLGQNLAAFHEIRPYQDTLVSTFASLEKGFSKCYLRNVSSILGFPDFVYTDATIQQLKNSGGFRMIHNFKAIERIMNYDAIVKKALINEASLGRALENLMSDGTGIYNRQAFDEQIRLGKTLEQLEAEKFDWLVTHDKTALLIYYNKVVNYIDLSYVIQHNIKGVKQAAVDLIRFLEKEYHLEEKKKEH